ncbi:HAD-IA family hydrolase [Paracoccaceae bacterium GXU_MW_L88]
MKTILFDLDGTLADTSADLIAAANHCFITEGFDAPLDPVADALTGMRGSYAMLKLGSERVGADLTGKRGLLLEYYDANIANETRLFDGVEAALSQLGGAGYKLGVATNKPEGLAEKLIGLLGIDHHFGALVGADTLPVNKPDPQHLFETVRRVSGDLSQSMLVGDTDTDVKAARNAAMPVVLVGFGPEGQGLARLEPDALFDHYDALPELVEKILP